MELKQLRAFVAVAEIQSFNKAAKSIFVSQPTLSYQISTLENELGVKLFVRDNPNVYLTPAAAELFPQVKSILSEIDNIKFTLTASAEKSPDHVLNVCFTGIPIHNNFLLSSSLVADFENSGKYEVQYNRRSMDRSIDALLDAELDVAFFGVHECDKLPVPLLFKAIDEDRLILMFSRDCDQQLTFKDVVSKFPIVIVDRMEGAEKEVDLIFQESSIQPRTVSADSLDDANDMVQNGEAAMFWPRKDYEKYLKNSMNAVEISSGKNKLFYGACWNNGNLKPALKEFLDTLPGIE